MDFKPLVQLLEWGAGGFNVTVHWRNWSLVRTAPNISGARMAAERIVLMNGKSECVLKTQECDPSGQVTCTAYACLEVSDRVQWHVRPPTEIERVLRCKTRWCTMQESFKFHE